MRRQFRPAPPKKARHNMNEPTVIEQLCDSYIGSLESDSEENKAAYTRCEAEYSKYNPNPH